LNPLNIKVSGLEIDNSPITLQADGIVTGVEVAGLDNNGSPEIYDASRRREAAPTVLLSAKRSTTENQ